MGEYARDLGRLVHDWQGALDSGTARADSAPPLKHHDTVT